MPARGRCEGCGHEDASLAKVARHTASCPKYLELFRRDPALALDPEESHARAHSEEAELERRIEKEDRSAGVRSRLQELAERRHQRSQRRWAGVTNHAATPADCPEDGVLTNAGRTEAQQAMLESMRTAVAASVKTS